MEDEKQNSPSLVSADEIRNGFNTQMLKSFNTQMGNDSAFTQNHTNFIQLHNERQFWKSEQNSFGIWLATPSLSVTR